jgi:hypothetical protein
MATWIGDLRVLDNDAFMFSSLEVNILFPKAEVSSHLYYLSH